MRGFCVSADVIFGRAPRCGAARRRQRRELARRELAQRRTIRNRIPFDEDDFERHVTLGQPLVVEAQRREEAFVEVAAVVVVAAGDDDAEEGRAAWHRPQPTPAFDLDASGTAWSRVRRSSTCAAASSRSSLTSIAMRCSCAVAAARSASSSLAREFCRRTRRSCASAASFSARVLPLLGARLLALDVRGRALDVGREALAGGANPFGFGIALWPRPASIPRGRRPSSVCRRFQLSASARACASRSSSWATLAARSRGFLRQPIRLRGGRETEGREEPFDRRLHAADYPTPARTISTWLTRSSPLTI